MAQQRNIKLYKQYLRERNLTRSFNTWKSLRKNRKKIIEAVSSNYDGTQSRRKLYAFSTKYGTSFRDFNTLKVVGRSRSKINQAISKINTFKKISVLKMFNGRSIDNEAKQNLIKLKNTHSVYSYNKSEQRLREIRKTNTISKYKVGSVGTDIEVRKGGSKFRMRVRSKFTILNKTNIGKLVDDNIRLVSGKAGYTPDEIIIHEIWYEYWNDTHEKLSRLR